MSDREPRCPKCRRTRCVVIVENPHPVTEYMYRCNGCGQEWIDAEDLVSTKNQETMT